MYSFSITKQLIVFLQSFGFGFIIGVVRSVIDLIFGLFLSSKWKSIISDIVFCIAFAMLLFCFVLAYNLGKLRLYLILGLCFGVIVYSFSLGDLISKVFLYLHNGISTVAAVVSLPFKKLFSYSRIGAQKIRHFFEKKLNKAIAKENKSGV